MLIMVLRLFAGLVAIVSGVISTTLVARMYEDPRAANGVMIAALAIISFTGLFSVACLVAGIWPPLRRMVAGRDRRA